MNFLPFGKILKILILISASFLSGLLLTEAPYSVFYEKTDVLNQRPDISATLEKSRGTHYSSFSDKNFFNKAFEKAGGVQKAKDEIKGVLVNHHLLAPDLIAKAFNVVTSDQSRTIVLISPNHFFTGRGQIISSEYDWQTPYGILKADLDIISKLKEIGAISIDEMPFEKEHGVSNIVAFIKKTIPNAKFIPLIVKDTISEKESEGLIGALEKILPVDALIVASFDFSHYLPSDMADFHDEKSIRALNFLNYGKTESLDIDSRPGLDIFLKIIKARGAESFTLFDHSNSAKVLNDTGIAETTSYISGIFTNKEEEIKPVVTALIFGDLMLDRYVRIVVEKKGLDYIFANIKRFLAGSDFVLANLEGSFTDSAPGSDDHRMKFTFDPELIPKLKIAGFNIFNLANNHALDFGNAGFIQSREYLKKNNLDYFGDPRNTSETFIIKDIGGLKIGWVGFYGLTNNINHILDEVKKIKNEVDIVAVYTHWGTEYNGGFSKIQQDQAHALIDAGADVVFGSHPHVIEPMEEYKGKMIFYSLGNFVFDQQFSEKTQQGLAIGAVFKKDRSEFYLFPIESKNIQINLISGDKKNIILKDISEQSEVSDVIKKQIKEGKISYDNSKIR